MPPVHVTSSSIPVPQGWKRLVEGGRVEYLTPDLCKLRSIDEVYTHILAKETCKCGLKCPFKVEQVFNFNPDVVTDERASPEELFPLPSFPGNQAVEIHHVCHAQERKIEYFSGLRKEDECVDDTEDGLLLPQATKSVERSSRRRHYARKHLDIDPETLLIPRNNSPLPHHHDHHHQLHQLRAPFLPQPPLNWQQEQQQQQQQQQPRFPPLLPQPQMMPQSNHHYYNQQQQQTSQVHQQQQSQLYHHHQQQQQQQQQQIGFQQLYPFSQQFEQSHSHQPLLQPTAMQYGLTHPTQPQHLWPRVATHGTPEGDQRFPSVPWTRGSNPAHDIPGDSNQSCAFDSHSEQLGPSSSTLRPSLSVQENTMSHPTASLTPLPPHREPSSGNFSMPGDDRAHNIGEIPYHFPFMQDNMGHEHDPEPLPRSLAPLRSASSDATRRHLSFEYQQNQPAPMGSEELHAMQGENPGKNQGAVQQSHQEGSVEIGTEDGDKLELKLDPDSFETSKSSSMSVSSPGSSSSSTSSSSTSDSSSSSSEEDSNVNEDSEIGEEESEPLLVSLSLKSIRKRSHDRGNIINEQRLKHRVGKMPISIPLKQLSTVPQASPDADTRTAKRRPPHKKRSLQAELVSSPALSEYWVSIPVDPQKMKSNAFSVMDGSQDDNVVVGGGCGSTAHHVPRVAAKTLHYTTIPEKPKDLMSLECTSPLESTESPPVPIEQHDKAFYEISPLDRTFLGLRPRKSVVMEARPPAEKTVVKMTTKKTKRSSGSEEGPTPLPKRSHSHQEEVEYDTAETYFPEGVGVSDLRELTFDIGSLVWARGKNLPFWPGVICPAEEIRQKPAAKSKHWVKWLGDTSFSYVEEASMRPLSEGMASFMSAVNKNKKKGVKDRQKLLTAFEQAFEKIQQAKGLLPENEDSGNDICDEEDSIPSPAV